MSVSRRSFAFDLASLCAPTLAGLKPASLFRYQPGAGQSGSAMAAAWHAALCDRGVAVRVLKTCPRTGAVLVYVYRPAQIDTLLKNCDVLHFFAKRGLPPRHGGRAAGAAFAAALLRGGFPPRGRHLLGLPAGGRGRVYQKPRAKFHRLRSLEGLHRPCRRAAAVCTLQKMRNHLHPLLPARHAHPAADRSSLI